MRRGRRKERGRERDRRTRSIVVVAALVVVALVTVEGTRAAFSASTSNGVNRLAAGTVTVADDDGGSVLFDLPAMRPDVPVTRCINVAYTGSVTADVRLHIDTTGALGPFLATSVEVGSGATGGTSSDCTGFVTSTTPFTGTLAALGTAHASYATGLGGFTGATTGASRSYRISMTMADDNAAQGLSSTATVSWEARPA